MNLTFAFIAAIAVWAASALWQRHKRKSAAVTILENTKKLYSGEHEFRQTDLSQFPFLDPTHYESTRAYLEGQGFRFLADVEDVTVSQVLPRMRSMLRCMSGDDGAIVAGIYLFKNRSMNRFILRALGIPSQAGIVDLETEFSDGSFIATSNTATLDRTGEVPGIRRFQHPIDTPVSVLLAHHRQSVAELLAADSLLSVRRAHTYDDIIAGQHRIQHLKNRRSQSIGYINEEELSRMAGPHLQGEAKQVIDEMRKLDK